MLDDQSILQIVGAELTNSTSGQYNTEIDGNREKSLSYYLGNLPGPAEEGRSQVVSTDVADAIEWILPQIVKAMVSKGPIITFDPVSEEDEEQAAIETEFVHAVFMNENPGFLNLYEFIKDALMQKNGIFKVYFDDTPDETSEQYDNLPENQVQGLAMDPEVSIDVMEQDGEIPVPPQAMQQYQMQMQQYQMQMQQLAQIPTDEQQRVPPPQEPQEPQPIPLFRVELTRTEERGRVVIESIPPEEFRVNEYHNSLDLQTASFTAHVVLKTRSELLEAGYDPKVIEEAAAGSDNLYQREYRWAEQGENQGTITDTISDDRSQDLIEVSECYMQMDVEETGIASLVKVTVLGASTPDTVLDIESVEEVPFVSSSCIVMPHKFYGLSIYDRLYQVQDQKTALWRNILDNLYLQNNREKEVVESQVNLDDLLVSRPGGIKRVKQPGMIRELQVQPIGQEGYQMLDYLDRVRTGRVGVSPDTMGAGLPVGGDTAHGVERMMSAKEELTALMIRTVAETGLKAAYTLVRDLLIRHKKGEQAFKYRGAWANINPSTWGKRSRTTVNVGTGTGDEIRKQGALREVMGYQAGLAQAGMVSLVDEKGGFNALDDFCQSTGLQGAEKYFIDPRSPEGQELKQFQEQKQQEMEQLQIEMQQKITQAQEQLAQAEVMKGQAALQSQQVKAQAEQIKAASAQQGLQLNAQISGLELQLEEAKGQVDAADKGAQIELDTEKMNQDTATKMAKIEMDMEIQILKMEQEDRSLVNDNMNKILEREDTNQKEMVEDDDDEKG